MEIMILGSGHLLEGLVEICDQVIDMLDPYRDSDQGIGQPALLPDLLGNRSMRHQGRMFDKRLHPSQTLSQGKDFHVF